MPFKNGNIGDVRDEIQGRHLPSTTTVRLPQRNEPGVRPREGAKVPLATAKLSSNSASREGREHRGSERLAMKARGALGRDGSNRILET